MKETQRRNVAIEWNGQTIRDALSLIDSTLIGCVVFVDANNSVLGFVSDGDIRRALIRGAELVDPVSNIWTSNPLALGQRTPIDVRYRLLRERSIRHLVLLDEGNRFAGLQTFQEVEELYEINPKRCPVVLMAGGRGTRLLPLTKDRPKPMLPIGGIPLLERTINFIKDQGFETFYISVNYLKEQIIEYFGNGETFGVDIQYLVEDEPTGTAGCLRLLPPIEGRRFLLMNGDVITDLDLRGLVNFHEAQKFVSTMVVREISTRIDYGVVRSEGFHFRSLDEKPVYRYFINSGIYALDTSVLQYLPGKKMFDMPDLFELLAANRRECGVFEHKGLWIDIGTPEQLAAANTQIASTSG